MTEHQQDRVEEPQLDQAVKSSKAAIDVSVLSRLEWRLAGPYRGGRVVAVAGDPIRTQVFYFGSTGGGIWKTVNGGLSWENISDGYFQRASVGAIAVAHSDPISSMSVWGRQPFVATSRMGMASTGQRMAGRAGPTRV